MRTNIIRRRSRLGGTVAAVVAGAMLTAVSVAAPASAAGAGGGPGPRKAVGARITSQTPITGCDTSLTPSRRWVQLLYLTALDRCAETAASDYGVSQFEPGTTRAAYSGRVFRSNESARVWADTVYAIVLDRPADTGGLTYWTNALRTGLRFDDMEAALLGSAEFFDAVGSVDDSWVSALYETMLDREPATSEVDYWAGRLDAGQSRTAVAQAIVHSHEGRVLDADIFGYGYVFHRSASDAEYDYWAGRLLGIDQLDLMALFVASNEGVTTAQNLSR